MGKKRVAQKKGASLDQGLRSRALAHMPKKKVAAGILNIEATFNNTRLTLTDTRGNTLAWSSSGALGFKGAKKGTPFAAAKIGEVIGEKALSMGMKEVSVVVKGVGQGREAGIRAFVAKGIDIASIADRTPVPHNGPSPRKPRRV